MKPITDFGACGDGETLNTKIIQQAIDSMAEQGGGTLLIPQGTFLSGALFFKPAVNLHLEKGAVLLGSNNIDDYPWLLSRIEGVTQNYYAALINASGCDHFRLSGDGVIDGNGQKFWEAFWERRAQNPQCTNLEVARPRLIFISYSMGVQLEGLHLQNAGFWTTHLYQCKNISLHKLSIHSPRFPVRAPSTDGIDLDVCSDVHISHCDISVNDDAICIKGGKGVHADEDYFNGPCKNVLIERCRFGWNHSVLTLGSEAIACTNIQLRDCKVDGAWIVFRCKLRPDTPQQFQQIKIKNIRGHAHTFMMIKDWTQFFNDEGETSLPASSVRQIEVEQLDFACKYFRHIECTPAVTLSDFKFRDMHVRTENGDVNFDSVIGVSEMNVQITSEPYIGNQGNIDEL